MAKPGRNRGTSARTHPPVTEAALRRAMEARGVDLPGERVERLVAYARLLQEWGGRTNLAGPAVLADPVPSLVEGLEPLRAGWTVPGPILDIGSGGGLPGIPLAVGLGLPVWLMEPRERRWAFLHHALRFLGIPGEALCCRWEAAVSRDDLPLFGALSSRALAGAAEWAEALGPKLAPGGLLLLFTGEEGRRSPLPPGFGDLETRPLASPGHFLRGARKREF